MSVSAQQLTGALGRSLLEAVRDGDVEGFADGLAAGLAATLSPLDRALGRSGGETSGEADGATAGKAPGGGTGAYTIVPGDTLGELAARFGTTVDALVRANPHVTNPDLIYAGDTLAVPNAGAGGPGGTEGGAAGKAGAGGAAAPGGTVAGSSDAQVQAVLGAMPPDVRAANPDAAEHVGRILEESRAQGLTPEQTAYVLATATHESGMGLYREELASGTDYEPGVNPGIAAELGNVADGDGVAYKGRGYVQITGRDNYADWGERLGVDLVGNPELAADPDIAAKILVGGMKEGTFTGARLDDFVDASGSDFVGARRVVNGTDRQGLIAGYAEDYAAVLESARAAPADPSSPTLADIGPEGSGSPIEYWEGGSEPVNLSGAGAEIEAMLGPIVAAYAAGGDPAPPLITSANDKTHSSPASRHYQDLALDLATNHLGNAQADAIAADIRARLGPDYFVDHETFPGGGNDHIHIEYQPAA